FEGGNRHILFVQAFGKEIRQPLRSSAVGRQPRGMAGGRGRVIHHGAKITSSTAFEHRFSPAIHSQSTAYPQAMNRVRLSVTNVQREDTMRSTLRVVGLSAFILAAASLPSQAQTAKAALQTADGKEAGSVTLTQTPSGVLLSLSVKG